MRSSVATWSISEVSNIERSSYRDRDSGGPGQRSRREVGCCMQQLTLESTNDAATATAFAASAAQDGMVEVALAGLALRKSGDNQLNQFAQKMLQDYAQSS